MLQDNVGVRTALILVSLVFLGFALFANLPALHQGFLFADQAVYFSMAQSLAFDGDIEYTRKDLVRYYEDFSAGPNGIFLKRVKQDGREKLFFAKNFAYPLFAAPFVRLFGPNGPLVFHAVLLFLLLLMGVVYFSLSNGPAVSFLRVLTFLFASVAGVYFLWIAPDFFNLFLVFTVLFLWLTKVRYRDLDGSPAAAVKSRWQRFLLSGASDYLAAVVAGIAVYSKPPNIAVMGPFLLWTLLKKRYARAAGILLCFGLSFGILFGTTYLMTSDWNYQGGERKTFYYNFPLEKDGVTFDNSGWTMSATGYVERTLRPMNFLVHNIFYYIFGRYTGITWYFFPAVLFLILFVLGKKSLDRWLLLVAAAGEILIYLVMMPDNYGGGGGSLGNRYFLNIYPLFLFLPGLKVKSKEFIAAWGMAALFLGQILLSPLQASARPSTHGKKPPFTLLPVELTLINELPTNTNPTAFRQQWGDPSFEDRFVYFLNDNYNRKNPGEEGWWTLGDRKADFILRTFFPVKEVAVHLLSNPRMANRITVTVEGRTQRVTLGASERTTLRFPVGNGFQDKQAHLYRLKIKSDKSSIPYYESESGKERRLLGVFFELEVIAK